MRTVRNELLAGDWFKMALNNKSLKLILLGNYSVGKNSILMRFVYDEFTNDNTMALNAGGFSTGSRLTISL